MKDFRSQGAAAAAFLRSSPLWPRYGTIFLFLSMNSEIDTMPLLETALKEGKKVFAPRVEAEGDKNSTDKLVFYPVLSSDGPWQKGPFGILEPAALPEAAAGRSDEGAAYERFPALVIVPGLAFDRAGNRLGRGGGYYDRFLAELDEAGRQYISLGLCMDFQIVSQVPVERNDKKVNGILTGKELTILK